MFKFSQKSLNRLNGVHPQLVRLAKEVIKISPIDFGISQGVRTQQEQADLYAQGRTKPGKIVTWTMKSKHLRQKDGYGHAFDIVCYHNGQVTWSEKFYMEMGDIFKDKAKQLGINIIWGGDFRSNKDYPHIELKS